MLEIPAAPAALELAVERRWDGAAVARPELRAWVRLAATPGELHVAAGMRHQRSPRIPDAPVGARIEGLWHYDVVECFAVGVDGRYLELELGAGGHYLALAFDGVRRRADDLSQRTLAIEWERDGAGWRSRCRIPRFWLPEPIAGVNAFAIAGGEFLAHHPVGGERPDFHRPAAFPRVRIPAWQVLD